MDREAKLNALRHIAMSMGDMALAPLLGFLAGRLDHLRFVDEETGSSVSVHLSAAARLWPRLPFRAKVDGEPLNNPIGFIEKVALRDDMIDVWVDFGVDRLPDWYRAAVESSVDPREALRNSIEQIRHKIDLALDAYRTANEAWARASDEDQQYLRFVLNRAKEEMRELNTELSRLEQQVGAVE